MRVTTISIFMAVASGDLLSDAASVFNDITNFDASSVHSVIDDATSLGQSVFDHRSEALSQATTVSSLTGILDSLTSDIGSAVGSLTADIDSFTSNAGSFIATATSDAANDFNSFVSSPDSFISSAYNHITSDFNSITSRVNSQFHLQGSASSSKSGAQSSDGHKTTSSKGQAAYLAPGGALFGAAIVAFL